MAVKVSKEQEAIEPTLDTQGDIRPAREAVVKLIVRMCDDVQTGRARNEYNSYEAIAKLMESIK